MKMWVPRCQHRQGTCANWHSVKQVRSEFAAIMLNTLEQKDEWSRQMMRLADLFPDHEDAS